MFALGAISITAALPAAAQTTRSTAAAAFDTSPPLGSRGQFIPDKLVVIHPAVESQPERQGAAEGLGTTSPQPSPARRGAGPLRAGQQGTYAPGGFYRWLGSMAMDRKGDIGLGYSFGGDPNYPGQRRYLPDYTHRIVCAAGLPR